MAYLTQAVQSRRHPVPLVAGEEALLRVFVTAARATEEVIPPVRARFFVDGSEQHVAEIPAGASPIPTSVDEGELPQSANIAIPGQFVRPGLEMVVEIDPRTPWIRRWECRPGSRRPGRVAVEVREMPVLRLTVIPFLWSTDPDEDVLEGGEVHGSGPGGARPPGERPHPSPRLTPSKCGRTSPWSASQQRGSPPEPSGRHPLWEGFDRHYLGLMSGTVYGADTHIPRAGRASR